MFTLGLVCYPWNEDTQATLWCHKSWNIAEMIHFLKVSELGIPLLKER